jgi:hypothetical protein
MLRELAASLGQKGVELRLANVHVPVLELLRRDGVAELVHVDPTLDAAVGAARPTSSARG